MVDLQGPDGHHPGYNAVTLTDGAHTATYQLYVYKATISVVGTAGLAGQEMSFTGAGWPSNDTITVSLTAAAGTATVCQVTSDDQGNFDALSNTPSQPCAMPKTLPWGPYTVQASDGQVEANAASTDIMRPSVTLLSETSPNAATPTVSAAVGQVVYFSAYGFSAQSDLSVTDAGTAVGATQNPVATDTTGAYNPTGPTTTSLPASQSNR